jgi:Pentapeptide repeats (8 copies)
MANFPGADYHEEQIHRLSRQKNITKLEQGVKAWNQWRFESLRDTPGVLASNLPVMFLNEVNLVGASLSTANFSAVDLSNAELALADLSRADLSGANLTGANLTGAKLKFANLRGASLKSARLQNAVCDQATLTGVNFWEAQRAGWSIKGVICERAFWDKGSTESSEYVPGEFERLFSEQPIVELFYKNGLSQFEFNTLPALLQHLARLHPNCKMRLKSVQETGGGAKVSITVDAEDGSLLEEIKAEALRAHAAQIAMRDDHIAQLKIERRLLLDEIFPRMLASAGHHVHIAGSATGVLIASGSASINAPVTANDLSSILPILDEVLIRRSELALPHDQDALLETAIRSVREELNKEKPRNSVIAEGMKMVKEIAVKAAVSAAEKTDWHSLLNQLTHLFQGKTM